MELHTAVRHKLPLLCVISLNGVWTVDPEGTKPGRYLAGQALYVDNCAACHTSAGTGTPQLFPALKGSPSVQSTDPASLIRVVLRGAQSVATDPAPTAPSMPALGWKLSDAEVAAVVTYIRNSWGNAALPVLANDVESARRRLSQRID
jgi:mono/diheme cytochrome c family protein